MFWLQVLGTAAAFSFAAYVITFVLSTIVFFVLIGWVKGDILKKSQDKLITNPMVERELVIKHPRLYGAFVSLPAFCLSLAVIVFFITVMWQVAKF